MPELKAKFTADDSQFTQVANRVNSNVSSITSTIGKMAASWVAYQGLGFLKSIANQAGEIQDSAEAIDITTDQLQRLEAMGLKAGVPLEKIETALNRIEQARLDAVSDRSGTAAKNFAAMGLALDSLDKLDAVGLARQMGAIALSAGRNSEEFRAFVDIIGVRTKRVVGVFEQLGSASEEVFANMNPALVASAEAIAQMDTHGDNLAIAMRVAKKEAIEFMAAVTGASDAFFRFLMGQEDPQSAGVKAVTASLRNLDKLGGAAAPAEGLKTRARMGSALDKMQDKTMSAFSNISDPVAAIGRGAGKDFSYDAAMSLREIAANTRRIQPTPAPTMR
jgi:hypothetical protein